MDNNDISAIIASETERDFHYMGIEAPKQRQAVEEEPDYIYESAVMPTVYFAKKSMKQLLDHRTIAFTKLNLKMKKNPNTSDQQLKYRKEGEKLVFQNGTRIFRECPSPLEEVSIVHIHDCDAIYTFFSSDHRFVPLCKKCNASVYLLTRFPSIKVYCSNPKCKLKIIAQDKILDPNGMTSRTISHKNSSFSSRKTTEKSQFAQSETSDKQKRFYSKYELELIKKTAQKIEEN